MQRVRHTTPEPDQRARELRREATPAEQFLWNVLRAGRLNGHKFRRQHPLGRFILDFYCARSRLCVEVDGEVHAKQHERDMARDATRRCFLAASSPCASRTSRCSATSVAY